MAIVAAGIAVLYFAREVLIPLTLAITLSFLLTSPVSWLQKLRLNRVAAVLLVIALTLSAATATAWIVGAQFIAIVNELPRYQQNIHNKLEALRANKSGALSRAAKNINDIGKEISSPVPPETGSETAASRKPGARPAAKVEVVERPKDTFQYLYEWLHPFFRFLGTLGVIVIFSTFMLINREDLRNRILRLAGLSQLRTVTQAFDDATCRISRFLRMQFVVNTGFAALISLGLFLIGLPSPALWGVVAGLFRLVPYVGILIASTLPLVLSLAVFDGWTHPLMVFALFAVTEILVANFIEPLVYGSHTGISALALLVATVFWAMLWGPAGLLLSAPLTVWALVIGRHVPGLSFLHILLGDEPALGADAQLFQRLLAMDQQEARDVVDQFLKDKPLVEAYDRLFVPALAMAEQERHKGALDPAREQFIYLSLAEIVAELSNGKGEPEAAVAANPAGRVLCFAAADQADELVADMLAQLVEQTGRVCITFPAGQTPDPSDLQPDDVLFISALPPFAFPYARALFQKLRRRFPKTGVAIGIWGFGGDVEKLRDRFDRDRPNGIVTSLQDALDRITGSAPAADSHPVEVDAA
ncbi:MAG TPA: AI-2E family transporter [Bryobacteraceae bacterium]|nr:AI-2E family transporter [Bryobacteraceae bacterium]